MSLNIGHFRPWRPYKLQLCPYKKKKKCSQHKIEPLGLWPFTFSRIHIAFAFKWMMRKKGIYHEPFPGSVIDESMNDDFGVFVTPKMRVSDWKLVAVSKDFVGRRIPSRVQDESVGENRTVQFKEPFKNEWHQFGTSRISFSAIKVITWQFTREWRLAKWRRSNGVSKVATHAWPLKYSSGNQPSSFLKER